MTSRKFHTTDIGALYEEIQSLKDTVRKMQNDKIINAPIRVAAELSSIVGSEGDVVIADAASLGAGGAIHDLIIVIDGAGSAITTGIKGDVSIDFASTITSWTLLADQSGSIVIDIWKDTYANYPPTVADTITASAKPTISSATKNTSSTLTGWTTAITAGDTLRFNVDSITTIQRAVLMLKLT